MIRGQTGLVLGRVGAMNLALEKGKRVTTGGKGRGEIVGEAGEVTGFVANVPTTDGLGKWHVTFSGWGNGSWKSGGTAGGWWV